MANVTPWRPLIPGVLLLPCRWCCVFARCTKHLQNERFHSNPSSAWPFLECSHSWYWRAPWGLKGWALRSWIQPSIHSSVSQTQERHEYSPQHHLFLDFSSERKFRTNLMAKVIQVHWWTNKLQDHHSFLQNQVCTLLELHKSSRGKDWQQKLPRKGWFWKNQQPNGRQHEAVVVYCSQPWAMLTKLQHCSGLLQSNAI